MIISRDIRSLLNDVIREETQWLRHYEAQVVDNIDSEKKGRVKVTIPELGFETADIGMWCFPRQGNSMSVPEIGSWVEIYFASGNPNKPRYLHYASEMKDMTPTKFDGEVKTRVLFESPKTKEYIKYDDDTKILEISITGEVNIINASKINLLGAKEAFIKGNSFDTWLTDTLKVLYDAHTHTYAVGPGITAPPAVPLTAPTNHLSIKIKGE